MGEYGKVLNQRKASILLKKSKGILDDPDFMKIEPKDFLSIE
jgi:hypothetical protein